MTAVPVGTYTGVAWLSSARVVRCKVKSFNERNPYLLLPAHHGGDSEETAGVKPEEGGDDVKSSWPLCLGLQTCYNAGTTGYNTVTWSKSLKTSLSSD